MECESNSYFISSKDKSYLNRAVGVALTSNERHKHGSLIVKGGRVISYGVNVQKNSPLICSNPKEESGRHAEREAIRRARHVDLKGATLYVARVNKKGDPLLSKPCVRCEEAIKQAGIKKVVFTV